MNKQEKSRQLANVERWLGQLETRTEVQLEALHERVSELEVANARLGNALQTVMAIVLVVGFLALFALRKAVL